MLTLLRARRGVAALEFAIVVPFVLALLFGVVDVSRAIVMARRLTVAAAATATIASTMAVQASNLNALTGQQAWQASTAPFANFPEWQLGQRPGTFAITLSSVVFTGSPSGCTTACSYAAQVAWSVANPAGQPRLRSCGTLGKAADGSASSLATLPADDYGPTSIVVADVAGVFTPMFTAVFLGSFTLQRSAYISPRINNGVALGGGYPGVSVTCRVAS